MDWVCPECDRRYDDPPERCVCGAQVVPEGTPEETSDPFTRVAENLYAAVFDPGSVNRGLLETGPRVRLAFRVLVVLSALFVVVAIVGSLL